MAGAALGLPAGLGYAKAILFGLTTLWRSAVGTSALQFHVTAETLLLGGTASLLISLVVIWIALRSQARQPARQLLNQGAELEPPRPRSNRPFAGWIALLCAGFAFLLIGDALRRHDSAAVESFFGAGALLLVAGLAAVAVWLRSIAGGANARLSLWTLALRGCARRRQRSLAVIALLAAGAFLIVAVESNKLDAVRDGQARASGTGGFALIGESSLPLVPDLNSPAGRDAFGFNEIKGVEFLPWRVHDGDEASCLNLNRAQNPRLLGVNPASLQSRGSFTFSQTLPADSAAPWLLLTQSKGDEIPAIGDEASIRWALGKKIGDTLDYTDERGRPFKLRLVGAMGNSILQGSLIIDEAEFVKRFPGETGHRLFLIDAPAGQAAGVSAALGRALQDYGLELTPTVRRLDAFNAVQNTYLNTFQVLGGLGLLLGSVGLGVVVLRNLLERRRESAILLALGFEAKTLRRLVFREHALLLCLGLLLGMAAALVALLPVLLGPGSRPAWRPLFVTLGLVFASGFLWTWLAARLALRSPVINSLREE